VTDRNTACVSKAVARSYNKITKGIVRMKLKPGPRAGRFLAGADIEIYRDKMASYLLSGADETAFAIVA